MACSDITDNTVSTSLCSGPCSAAVECVCPDVKPGDALCGSGNTCETHANCFCFSFLTDLNRDTECTASTGACDGDIECSCSTLNPGDAGCSENGCATSSFCTDCATFITNDNMVAECATGKVCAASPECVCPDVMPGDDLCGAEGLCNGWDTCACETYVDDSTRTDACAEGGPCALSATCVCPNVKPGDETNCGTGNLCENTDFCHCARFLTPENREAECTATTGACDGDVECSCSALSVGDAGCSENGCELTSFCVDCATVEVTDANFDDYCGLSGACASEADCMCFNV